MHKDFSTSFSFLFFFNYNPLIVFMFYNIGQGKSSDGFKLVKNTLVIFVR